MSRRLLIALVLLGALAAPACAASWGNAAIVERDGFPIFEYAGKPFFLYGAAFFYERLPRELWASSMDELQALGINTLDLYVPWNWHETSDGAFDFDGHTNPRRDLDTVLRLARAHGFAIVLRPGPVIRNEWRNGGYPAWLLTRPEYGMPLHDVLEGRYPATATLQNAHSDDAAAQWMRNATHVRYARRWLQRVLRECAPFADRILAVALDDDQGAYIDNQTYPAPHFIAYLDWLRGVVHAVTGPRELVFINTYQMKVPASSPVWAMGNWYQSDAYALGEHDRAQLEFSTALLHTRPHQPLFASEFQAGWLEAPDDVRPRPADRARGTRHRELPRAGHALSERLGGSVRERLLRLGRRPRDRRLGAAALRADGRIRRARATLWPGTRRSPAARRCRHRLARRQLRPGRFHERAVRRPRRADDRRAAGVPSCRPRMHACGSGGDRRAGARAVSGADRAKPDAAGRSNAGCIAAACTAGRSRGACRACGLYARRRPPHTWRSAGKRAATGLA
jgi:hypothetical protein